MNMNSDFYNPTHLLFGSGKPNKPGKQPMPVKQLEDFFSLIHANRTKRIAQEFSKSLITDAILKGVCHE